MGIYTDISDQWQIADDAFAARESAAFIADDDAAFDQASEQRKRNDQAYFLFMFTRFEQAVTDAAREVVKNRTSGSAWQDARVWEAWKAIVLRDERHAHFMSKFEVLKDKSSHTYELIKGYYAGRNNIGHGGIYAEQFFIPEVAIFMDRVSASFPTV